MDKVKTYIKETIAEMKHVNWPSREQSIAYTILVILISVVVALFLYACDELFLYILRTFILKS